MAPTMRGACLVMVLVVGASIAQPTESPSQKTGKSAQRRVTFRDRDHDDDIIIGGSTISDFDRNRFVTPNPTRIVTVTPGFHVTPSIPGNFLLNQGSPIGGIFPSDGLFRRQILPIGGTNTLGLGGGSGILGGGILGGVDPRTLELLVARNPSILLQYPEILLQSPHLLLQYPDLAIQYPQLRQYVDPRFLNFGGNVGFGGNTGFGGNGFNNQFPFRRVFPSNFGGGFGGLNNFNNFNRFNNINGLQGLGGLNTVGTGLDFNQPIDINGFNRPILSTISPIAVTTLSPFNRNIRFNKK